MGACAALRAASSLLPPSRRRDATSALKCTDASSSHLQYHGTGRPYDEDEGAAPGCQQQ